MSVITIGLLGILLLTIIAIFCFYFYRSFAIENSFLKNIPVPETSLPLFGVALDFASTKDLLKNLSKYMDTYGDIVRGKIGPFRHILLIANYELLENILTSQNVITKSVDYDFLRPWLGNGLLTSTGSKWKSHRRILTPAFHFQILEQFVEIFERCGNILIKKLEKHSNENNIDIYPYISLYTLDVICESIMGTSAKAQVYEKSDYVRSVKKMCKIVMDRSISPIQMYDSLFFLSKNYYIQRKALEVLHKQSNDVISARKKELLDKVEENVVNHQSGYFKNKKPFLDLLLQAEINGRALSSEEIREEVDTFMFEGHDTTASALSFTLFCLANNERVQKKALEEQQEIFGDRLNPIPTYTDLQNMKYLELVIKESLRLYPSVPFYAREVEKDFEYNNSIIPKGTTLMIFAFKIQRNPKYFENPDDFYPERFENVSGKQPYAYIPFSAGPRNCIGQKFAMLEMKCIVSKILREFELQPASPLHKLELISETILKSANGIKIRLRQRD